MSKRRGKKREKNIYKSISDVGSLQASLRDVESRLETAHHRDMPDLYRRRDQIRSRLGQLGADTSGQQVVRVESRIVEPTAAEVAAYSNPNTAPAKPQASGRGSELPFGVMAELEDSFGGFMDRM